MRENGSIDGEELFDGIVCPTCFTLLATVKGVADTWYLVADEVLVPLETVTPSGRVWSDELRLWVDP